MKYPRLDTAEIIGVDFSKDQYYPVETKKTQICLHHTASGKGADGDWRSWLSNPERVATCVIIDSNGKINQLYSSKFWGHHLGIQQDLFNLHNIPPAISNNQKLNQACIGIEIDSWGPLVYFDGAYRSYTGTRVPNEEVVEYFQAFKSLPQSDYFQKIGVVGKPCHFYQKYTTEQIVSVARLLEYWHEVYGIPLDYNEDMWGLSLDALKGKSGVWTHVSYRNDKMDCHPYKPLIEMLKSLAE